MKRIILPSLLCILAIGCTAGSASAEDYTAAHYQAQILESQNAIDPMVAGAFGDRVDPRTGSLGFRIVDVSLDGNGPSIQVSRVFNTLTRQPTNWLHIEAFADWELEIPRLQTEMYMSKNGPHWPEMSGSWLSSSNTAPGDRCTQFGPPPKAHIFWPGVDLILPGAASQKLMLIAPQNGHRPSQSVAGTLPGYPLTTNREWAVACLPSIKSGQGGQGFLVTDDQGNKYWFDYLISSPGEVKTINWGDGGGFTPGPGYTYFSIVKSYLYVTRIEDKVGNWITFNYNGRYLERIQGSDGREVALNWQSRAMRHRRPISDVPLSGYLPTNPTLKYISQVIVQPGSASSRTFNYEYSLHVAGTLRTNDYDTMSLLLSAVVLPDGSRWSHDLGRLSNSCDGNQKTIDSLCQSLSTWVWDNFKKGTPLPVISGSITAPSGATASYTQTPGSAGPVLARPPSGENPPPLPELGESLRQFQLFRTITKTVSGPGLVTSTWRYQYLADVLGQHSSISPPSGYDPDHIDAFYITNPDSSIERTILGNIGFDVNEGKVLQEDWYSASDITRPVKTVRYTYAGPAGPYASRIGDIASSYNAVAPRQWEQHAPLQRVETTMDAGRFIYNVDEFDEFARPRKVTRSSSD